MVTRSLVSYDEVRISVVVRTDRLNGHQIIGELRLSSIGHKLNKYKLNGHQIIGELRHYISLSFNSC